MAKDILRRCRFKLYGEGPAFSLTMWDTHRRDNRGQTIIGYRLTGSAGWGVVFEGEDFAGSPMHSDDSDATVRSLMTFLTLRPGDTDRDYFAKYTKEQLAFCDLHAEYLGYAAAERFGED